MDSFILLNNIVNVNKLFCINFQKQASKLKCLNQLFILF